MLAKLTHKSFIRDPIVSLMRFLGDSDSLVRDSRWGESERREEEREIRLTRDETGEK